jgi:transcriptional regulator with GAF, ATPase, and Fis domain
MQSTGQTGTQALSLIPTQGSVMTIAIARSSCPPDVQSIARCLEYPWPGNVRELENLVERAVILCPEPVFSLNPFAQAEAAAPGTAFTTLDALIRAHVVRALKLCGGKIYGADGAARLLGLKPSTLQSKMLRFGITR